MVSLVYALMRIFTATAFCTSGAFCERCRDKHGGRRWRENLRLAFALPGDTTEFDCPRGLLWDSASTVRPAVQRNPAPMRALAENRLVACRACDDWAATKCGRYASTVCRFKTYLARPGAVCLAALGVGGDTGPSKWPSL